jgi:hypothetical protein
LRHDDIAGGESRRVRADGKPAEQEQGSERGQFYFRDYSYFSVMLQWLVKRQVTSA